MPMPEYVILDTAPFVQEIRHCMKNHVEVFDTVKGDPFTLVQDILEQLHFKDEAEVASNVYISDLRSEIINNVLNDKEEEFLASLHRFSENAYNQYLQFGIYNQDNEVNYCFDNMVGDDVVLVRREEAYFQSFVKASF